MASKKKSEIIENEPVIIEEQHILSEEEAKDLNPEAVVEVKAPEVKIKKAKHKIGDIVFVSKEADADLNGFKLFPQYKKYTYTVEAYDADSDVYTLRRLNLSLKLKESDIVAPHERENSSLVRKQF